MSRAPFLSALLLVLGGCHSITPYLERYATVAPTAYVVVAPTGRIELPCVQSFLSAKRDEGFAVSTLDFDPAAPPAERLRDVALRLARQEPPAGHSAYVLFLATDGELPPGPWHIVGIEDAISSDLPLLLGDREPDVSLDEATWTRAFARDFPWIPGRIPFADEATLARALARPTPITSEAPPMALLGAERFAVWWDTSLVMSRARRPFEDHGWRVLVYSEDCPCDIELGSTDAEDIRAQHALVGLQPGPPEATLVLAAHWAHLAPDVVYLNSHGSSLFITEVGDYLLSVPQLDRLKAFAAGTGIRSVPAHPAVVVIAACRAGPADSDLTRRLFEDGWARVVVASMENTNPEPLWVAIWAEIDTAEVLSSRLPVGLGMRALRESYFEDALGSWSFLCFDSTRAAVAQNLLALTLYGDPAQPVLAPRRGARTGR